MGIWNPSDSSALWDLSVFACIWSQNLWHKNKNLSYILCLFHRCPEPSYKSREDSRYLKKWHMIKELPVSLIRHFRRNHETKDIKTRSKKGSLMIWANCHTEGPPGSWVLRYPESFPSASFLSVFLANNTDKQCNKCLSCGGHRGRVTKKGSSSSFLSFKGSA